MTAGAGNSAAALVARRFPYMIESADVPLEGWPSELSKFQEYASLYGNARTGNFRWDVAVEPQHAWIQSSGTACPTAAYAVLYAPAWQRSLQDSFGIEHAALEPWLQQLLCWPIVLNTAAPTIHNPTESQAASPRVSPALLAPAATVQTDRQLLETAALAVFPRATFSLSVQPDSEEAWNREVLYVSTGVEDIDARMALEEQFYSYVTQHESVTEALRSITVFFD